VDDERYQRMLHNARQVLGRGFLRPGLTGTLAANLLPDG
jgi:hypothetical protein